MDFWVYSMLAVATLVFIFMTVSFVFLGTLIFQAIREYRSATKNERMLAAGLIMVIGAIRAVWKK